MKKLLGFLSMLFSVIAIAQPEGRVFTVTNQPYANVVSPVKITTNGWDDFDAKVPLGFTFHLFGKSTDTLYFDGTDNNDNNYGADVQFSMNTNNTTPVIGFNWTDFLDRSADGVHDESKVFYKKQTVNGKIITKIEWRDVGFAGDADTNFLYSDSVNFQYWFYQDNDDFEVHFGSSNIASPYSSLFFNNKPFFGFFRNYDILNFTFDTTWFVHSLNPAVIDSISLDSLGLADTLGFDMWPSDGTVFRFSKPPVGILGVQLNTYASVFPTAFIDQLFINISKENFEGEISMIDMNGRIIARQKAMNGNNILQTSNFSSGAYIINIKSKEESVFYKVIKH